MQRLFDQIWCCYMYFIQLIHGIYLIIHLVMCQFFSTLFGRSCVSCSCFCLLLSLPCTDVHMYNVLIARRGCDLEVLRPLLCESSPRETPAWIGSARHIDCLFILLVYKSRFTP